MNQQHIGQWIAKTGQLLLFLVFVICIVDIFTLQSRGSLMVPFTGYLTVIFTGVAMQVLAAIVSNLQLGDPKKLKKLK